MARLLLTAACLVLLVIAAIAAARAQEFPADYPGPSPDAARDALAYTPQLGQPGDTGAELERILAQADYREESATFGGDTWFDKFARWMQQFSGQRNAPGAQARWTWILTAVIAGLLLVYLLTRLVWWLTGRRRDRAGAGDDTDGERRLSPEGLLRLAEESAARGDHRSAVRYRYLALLKGLQMPDSPLRTNSQVMRWIARKYPAAAGGFTTLVACYEDAWYGGRPCTTAEYSLATECAAGVEALIEAQRERDAVREQVRKERRDGQA